MAELKKFTRKEISQKNSKNETFFIIHNVVYDATPFLDEHPGGHEVLKEEAGKDASEMFGDVGHSFDARELMKKFAVGELVDEDKVQLKKRQVTWDNSAAAAADAAPGAAAVAAETGFLSSWKFPFLMGVLMTVLYSYMFG